MSQGLVAVEPGPKAHVVTQLKHPLPDAQIAFERHLDILKAYVVLSKDGKEPVSYKDVGKHTVSAERVSGNSKFFEHIGLLSKVEGVPGRSLPTTEAVAIRNDLAWNSESSARGRLSKLLSRSWFWQASYELLAIKGRVAEDELLQHLGREAGADPRKHMPSLKVLVEYLVYSQLLERQDDFVTLTGTNNLPIVTSAPLPENMTRERPELREQVVPLTSVPGGQITFGVFVSPEMTEEQIRRAVRVVLEEIRKPGQTSEREAPA